MKIKIAVTFIMLCVFGFSFGQDYKNNTKSIKEVDLKIEEGSYNEDNSVSADRLIIKTPEESESASNDMSSRPYSDEEWADIKKQMLTTKKRMKDQKEIFASKLVDTVFVLIPPTTSDKSKLSGW